MWKEPKRARRIRLTRRVAARRRSDHLALIHGDPTGSNVDCVCELADTYFAKIKGRGCMKCSSRRKGRPKLSGGMCKFGRRDRIYFLRRQVRQVKEMSRRSKVNWEADDVVILCLPTKINKCDVRCANCHTRKTFREVGGVYKLTLTEDTANAIIKAEEARLEPFYG